MRGKPFVLSVVLSLALAVALVASAVPATAAWHAKSTGLLDCNGYSPVQRVIKQLPCLEIAANDENGFEENGHYIGHDEADLGWFSNKPGSGTRAQWDARLPVDPPGAPSVNGPVSDFQLRATQWFGMVLCDNQSYPEGKKTCTTTDDNIQVPPTKNHAGAAFLELQLYPPGYPPYVKKLSCDRKHWCAAMAIFSLQGNFGALHGPGSPPNAVFNPNCTEPANFAFLTLDGKPVGPPGPDQANLATFTPTRDVMLMDPGDRIRVTVKDSAGGVVGRIKDRTTGTVGRMKASEGNGFRHILWDPVNFTCKGAPYAFHPMYDSAAPPRANGQPRAWTTWSAHTDNLSTSAEIGHFEAPDNDGDDANCFGGPQVPGCLMFGAGDTDFDGYSYQQDWPDGSSNTPTPFYMSSARTGPNFNSSYGRVRFETDLPRIEEPNSGGNCNHHTGGHCTNPPPGAQFYPWYHLASIGKAQTKCAWTISDDLPNQISNFGGEQAAWGPLEQTDYGFDLRYHNFANSTANPCP